MRIAAISDIHGNIGALTAVLDDIARRGCDVVVNLGDILSGPLQPVETADRLMALALPTIRGNHERQLLETPPDRMGASDAYARSVLGQRHLDWLRTLPATLELTDEVFLCHGTPQSDLEYFLEQVDPEGHRAATSAEIESRCVGCDYPVILCGHTHTPRAVRLADGRLLVNPGSVGLQAFHWDRPYPHKMETGDPRARYALVERDHGDWGARLIAVDYDFEPPAIAAEQRGRPEWAYALRSGRMPVETT